jgi:hypothetical protein
VALLLYRRSGRINWLHDILRRPRIYMSATHIENSYNAAAEGAFLAQETLTPDIPPHREVLQGENPQLVYGTAQRSGRPAPAYTAPTTSGASAARRIHTACRGYSVANNVQGRSQPTLRNIVVRVTRRCDRQRRASHW